MKELIKNLSGHSGCSLSLLKDDDRFLVRKKSGTADYNLRLKKQFIKQKKFISDAVKTPEIYENGYEDGMFYFDMQYLNCSTLAQYLESINISEINKLVSLLFASLPIKNSVINPKSNQIFQKKIKSLQNIEHKTKTEEEAVSKLLIKDFSNIPESYCCGDLTLENILITHEKEIYLIDFLDSFYNSWMIDIAKIFQDLENGWSYRKEKMSTNLKIRILVTKEAFIEKIKELKNGHNLLIDIYYILLLNLMRIVPYTKDEMTKEFLQNNLEKTLKIINELELS